jgi:lipopolysaccharide biosynthesis regulator YciM
MDFDLQWLLIGLPAAFALGWVAARLDQRQWRRDAPSAYVRGLVLLLGEQQDKAVDTFIEAVQHDPGASELHFALGSLFRRRGEYERAVRVHQHLLGRGDLPKAERDRARYALAQDYMKAGLFDRAEEAYQALQGSHYEADAQLALLALAERSRDWSRASELAAQLQSAGRGSFATRIAHHACEQALQADDQGRPEEAAEALRRARATAPQAPRPLLLAGQRAARAGDADAALEAFEALRRVHPGSFLLVAADYADAAQAAGRAADARALLLDQLAVTPSIELVRALARLDGQAAPLQALLSRQPTLSAALELLQQPPAEWSGSALQGLREAVARAARPLQRYRCAACGFEGANYFWQCPGCLSWDSFPPQRIEEL